MKRRRTQALAGLAKGFFIAAGVTLIGMLLLAAAVVFLNLGDGAIRVLNQILKALAVIVGTRVAVGRGGQRGLMTGAAVGAAYAIAGYVSYILLGGGMFALSELLGEMLVSVAAGAASGAVLANLAPRGKRAAAR